MSEQMTIRITDPIGAMRFVAARHEAAHVVVALHFGRTVQAVQVFEQHQMLSRGMKGWGEANIYTVDCTDDRLNDVTTGIPSRAIPSIMNGLAEQYTELAPSSSARNPTRIASS